MRRMAGLLAVAVIAMSGSAGCAGFLAGDGASGQLTGLRIMVPNTPGSGYGHHRADRRPGDACA
jgi:hypothetical protein